MGVAPHGGSEDLLRSLCAKNDGLNGCGCFTWSTRRWGSRYNNANMRRKSFRFCLFVGNSALSRTAACLRFSKLYCPDCPKISCSSSLRSVCMNTTLASTPLTAWHLSHGARTAEFAGYQMPIQYSTIVAEHKATRTAAGLFDISHMGRLRFEGGRADQLL